MFILRRRCGHCGGNLFYDLWDREVRCLACARPDSLEGVPPPLLELSGRRRYDLKFRIPRSLRQGYAPR